MDIEQYATEHSDPQSARLAALYRRTGLHPFTDAAGSFTARIADVAPDGRLHLIDSDGRDRHYWFKEVQFVIPAP